MHILSLNTGKAKTAKWQNKKIETGIFKTPVYEKLFVSFTGIETDEQADLKVHGGIDKAVYSYDISYYEHWKKLIERDDWSYGLFGENLTTFGLPDEQVKLGNIYSIGTCKLMAVQPRFPCTKINLKFGLTDMIEQFIKEQRSGIYFKVIEEGYIQTGDEITLIESAQSTISIKDFTEVYYSKGQDIFKVEQILAFEHLPARMRTAFESFIAK